MKTWWVLVPVPLVAALCLPAEPGNPELRPPTAAPGAPDPTPRLRELIAGLDVEKQIVRPPSGLLKYDYLVPSGPFHQLFDWDAYFMGVAVSYDHEARYLASTVRNFLEYTGEPTSGINGYVPRIIAPEGFWSLPEMCKPFLAQMTYLASESMRNYWWVRGLYPKLARTLYFWENSRRTPDGLFVWFNGDESGVDNTPAVSWEPSEVTEGVDLACYLVREYRAMALIARHLEKPDDEAAYRRKADELARLINEKMWSEADAMYFNIDRRTGELVKVKAWVSFVPLWAGIAPPDRAKATIERHLLEPREFWGPHGLRTLTPDEPKYAPSKGYWKGPTWVVSSYMMTHALARYGYRDRALEEARRVIGLLVRDLEETGGMNENYDPDTGAPAAGTNFMSWNLLALHWVDELTRGENPISLGEYGTP
jgi:putative isomerase